jgi:hypothetical protein
MLDVRDQIETKPDQWFLFQENPLEMGYHLQSIIVFDEGRQIRDYVS